MNFRLMYETNEDWNIFRKHRVSVVGNRAIYHRGTRDLLVNMEFKAHLLEIYVYKPIESLCESYLIRTRSVIKVQTELVVGLMYK